MAQETTSSGHSSRDKVLQVYKYLRQLHLIRHPVPLRLDEQPFYMDLKPFENNPLVFFRAPSTASLEETSESAPSAEVVFRVARPKVSEPPSPAEQIRNWVVEGWSRVDYDPAYQPLLLVNDQEEAFQADASRGAAFDEWSATWRSWREREREGLQARECFERLYRLYNELKRDSEQFDLLVGDGLLEWSRGGEDDIDHPILLKRVELIFNADVPEFVVQDSIEPTETYEALLGKIAGLSPTLIPESRQQIQNSGIHPLDGSEVTIFLKQFITQLHVDGRFVDDEMPPQRFPTVSRSPVLLTRKRTLGYAAAIDSMIGELESDGVVPEFLVKLVSHNEAESDASLEIVRDIVDTNGEAEDILLTKPANAEQLEIARRLRSAGGVVVQGPPGTGKSHTIANLVGHLLADGRRVLITSHTAKALEVVRDLVVEPLRPLCVSVLGADATSRAQMESAINEMTARLGQGDVKRQDLEESQFSKRRGTVLTALRAARTRLLDARNDEYQEIEFLGQRFPPSDAARYVRENSGRDGWIPQPVVSGVDMPLSQGELTVLYRLGGALDVADIDLLELDRPKSGQLMSPDTFASLVEEHKSLASADCSPQYWTTSLVSATQLFEVVEGLKSSMEMVSDLKEWEMEAVLAGMAGPGYIAGWSALVDMIVESAKFAAEVWPQIEANKPEILDENMRDVVDTLRAMHSHVGAGKKIRKLTLILHRNWQRVLDVCKVHGQTPTKPEHFRSLVAQAQLLGRRRELRRRWLELIGTQVFDIDSHPQPERGAEQYLPRIKRLLDWHAAEFLPSIDRLVECGLLWDRSASQMPENTAKFGELARLQQHVTEGVIPDALAQYRAIRILEIKSDFDSREAALIKGDSRRATAHYSAEVAQLIRERNVAGYVTLYGLLRRLEALEPQFEAWKGLLGRLLEGAPAWACAIKNRTSSHERGAPPGDGSRAWLWAQLDQELTRRSKVSIPELQLEIERLSSEFRELTAAVAERRAWSQLLAKTTSSQRSALQMYKSAVKQFGSGKGKRAARFARLAQEQMRLSQDAVPVWVMPLSRAYLTYHQPHIFDVLIIDEASQADIYSLLAMAYAKTVIIVGDDEQVTPERPGTEIARVDQLIDAFLAGVPGKDLFIEETSIFDFAKVAFGTPIVLTEHFRCVEPIIRFSNALSYNGSIKPLRDSSEVTRKPSTVAVRVPGAESTEQLNPEEAVFVASLVCAMIEQPEYIGATFGVIAMNGAKQGLRIESILRRYLEPKEIEARRLRCGMPPQFQGDERDVMLLSLVDSPDEHGSSRDPGYGPRDRTKKRYNVAASRARDQLWVCHSLNPDRLKPADLRRRLILHANNPDATEIRKEQAGKRAESELERRVQSAIIDAGYRIIPQYSVGSYRIDMLVTDGAKTLAIECDGDRYHTFATLEDDMSRQMILERCGYRFERIRGTEFFRDPKKALRPVFARLETLGIAPASSEPPQDSKGTELRDRILARAGEIRKGWGSEPDTLSEATERPTKRWGRPFQKKASSSPQKRPEVEHSISTPAETSSKIIRLDERLERRERVASDDLRVSARKGQRPDESNPATSAVSAPSSLESLVMRLEKHGLSVHDNRNSTGSLWVLGGRELTQLLEPFRLEGIKFIYAENGSAATGYKPGWFTTSDA